MFDYIEMRDGDNENSTLLGRFCGDQSLAPELITSTYNYLWMTFVTDGSVQNRGFVLNYTTVEVCSGIGGILRDTAGIIRSPAHPQEYPHGVTCRWVNGKLNISGSYIVFTRWIIAGEPGTIIRLSWLNFNLEESPGCAYDYLAVYDNTTIPNTGAGQPWVINMRTSLLLCRWSDGPVLRK